MASRGTDFDIEKNLTLNRPISYSGLKLYLEDSQEFYNNYILGLPKKDKDSDALKIGSLIDHYIFTCNGNEQCFQQEFDKYFVLATEMKSTKQVYTLVDRLFEITKDETIDGVVGTTFEDRFQRAFDLVQKRDKKYVGKALADGLTDFNDNGKEYFDLKLKSVNKKIVDLEMVELAKSRANYALNDTNMQFLFTPTSNIEDLGKLELKYEYNGFEWKAELDKVHVNHLAKEIVVYDGKTSYQIDEKGFRYNYLVHKYYLQNAIYNVLINIWKDKNYPKYTVKEGVNFILIDTSKNPKRPLVWETSKEHTQQGLEGFTYKNMEYKGVNGIIEEIKWSLANNQWGISKYAYEHHGVVELGKFE